MQKYKSLAIKIGLVAVVLAVLASPYGKQHAEEIKLALEMVPL